MPETDNPDLERRQWLFDHFAGGSGAYPPAAVVHALTSLQLPEPYDLAWATATYADDTAETTWSGAFANSTVLVEFTATAELATLHGWDGNSTRDAVEYDKAPVIELDVSRLADVASLTVTATGANDTANHAHSLRQTWVFTSRLTSSAQANALHPSRSGRLSLSHPGMSAYRWSSTTSDRTTAAASPMTVLAPLGVESSVAEAGVEVVLAKSGCSCDVPPVLDERHVVRRRQLLKRGQ